MSLNPSEDQLHRPVGVGDGGDRWARGAAVPAVYAEKAMASLLELHRELMDEKERRIELTERLSGKEQQLAELAGYVKLLEERMFAAGEKRAAQEWEEQQARDAEASAAQENPSPRAAAPTLEAPAGEPAHELAAAAIDEPKAVVPPDRRDGWRAW